MEDQKFRDLMAHVPAPVTVITTYDQDGPHGTTVSAFSSLSLNPKLVMVSMDNNSRILRRIRHIRHLGINLLSEGQGELAMRFARDEQLRFAPSDWRLDGAHHMPRLDGTAAWMEASLAYELPAGDHTILACEVIDAELHGPLAIVYSNRAFGANDAAKQNPTTDAAS